MEALLILFVLLLACAIGLILVLIVVRASPSSAAKRFPTAQKIAALAGAIGLFGTASMLGLLSERNKHATSSSQVSDKQRDDSASQRRSTTEIDKYDELTKLRALLDAGTITKDQFEDEKRKILAR